MRTLSEKKLRTKIRNWIILFIVFLILSGLTAFPLETEMTWLNGHSENFPENLRLMIAKTSTSIHQTNLSYPELAYGTDWLAFAHIVIAMAFIGPLMNPVKNIWVIQFGMIACIMVFPLAMIAGPIRHIPFYWRMIDCSFGVFGFFPLLITYKYIKQLEFIRT